MMLVFCDQAAPAKQPATPPPAPRPRLWWFIALGLLLGLVIWAWIALPATVPVGGAL